MYNYVTSNRRLAKAIMMTSCDLCASAKPWDIQLDTVKVIFEEFYVQVQDRLPMHTHI